MVIVLFHAGFHQSNNGFGFFGIGLEPPHTLTIGHTIIDHCRKERTAAGIPKWLDFVIIGQHITESDDFGHTTEMLPEHQGLECRGGNVINRRFSVIQMRIWNFVMQIHLFQCTHFICVCADSHWTDLLIIANNNQLFAHIQNSQRRNIRLTGLINNNNIELVLFRIQTFQRTADRHNPTRNSYLAL